MAREEGVEEVVVGLTYSISPAHTHAYYAERAAAVAASPDIDRLYLKDPGGLADGRRRARAGAAGSSPPSPPRPVELHSHCTIGLAPLAYMEGLRGRHPHAAHGGRAGGQRDVEPARRVDAAQPRGRGVLARSSISRRSPRSRRTSASWRSTRGLPLGAPGGVRRGLLPPSDARRHGHDDAAPARGAAPARALRRGARGGHARPRRDGLPDHGHAGLAVRGHAGRDERDLGRALAERLGRDACGTSSATTTSRRRRWTPDVARSRARRCRARTSCAASSRSASTGARERFGARISEEELLLRLTMPAGAGRRDGERARRGAARAGRAARS